MGQEHPRHKASKQPYFRVLIGYLRDKFSNANKKSTVANVAKGDLSQVFFVADLIGQAKLGIIASEEAIENDIVPLFKKAQAVAKSLTDKKVQAHALEAIDAQIALNIRTLVDKDGSLSAIEALQDILSDVAAADNFLAAEATYLIDRHLTAEHFTPKDLANLIAHEKLRLKVKTVIAGNATQREREILIRQGVTTKMVYQRQAATFATTHAKTK